MGFELIPEVFFWATWKSVCFPFSDSCVFGELPKSLSLGNEFFMYYVFVACESAGLLPSCFKIVH